MRYLKCNNCGNTFNITLHSSECEKCTSADIELIHIPATKKEYKEYLDRCKKVSIQPLDYKTYKKTY